MDKEMMSRVKGLEQLGVPMELASDTVFLMAVLSEMTCTDSLSRLQYLSYWSERLMLSIRSGCFARFGDDDVHNQTLINKYESVEE